MDDFVQVVLRLRALREGLDETAEAEIYQVDVLEAPGRGWGGPLTAGALDAGQIYALRARYRAFLLRQQSGIWGSLGEHELHPLRVLGNQLYEILPESVQERINVAQAYASQRSRLLRLVFVFSTTADALLSLPWELIHHPSGRFFFALRGGVTRQLELPTAYAAADEWRPRAPLGLWAGHKNDPDLLIRQTSGPGPGNPTGAIDWAAGPDSLGQLQKALATKSYDALHIVAHGKFERGLEIALLNTKGEIAWTNVDQLAIVLGAYPTILFVYLDVCTGGESWHREQEDSAFLRDTLAGGLAGTLLGIGVMHALVMQDFMGQAASGLFAATFYEALARNGNLSTAVAQARQAVRLKQDDPVHWSVPVLYTPYCSPPQGSPGADWILERGINLASPTAVMTWLVLFGVLGHLANQLAQLDLMQPLHWQRLMALVVESMLLPILAAAMTRAGQKALGKKYGFQGRTWLPALLHKFFSANVWAFVAWVMIWAFWLVLLAGGWTVWFGFMGRQIAWTAGLLVVTLAGHVGARQALKQEQLFRRVGFVAHQSSPLGWVLLTFSLFFPALLAGAAVCLLALWQVWSTSLTGVASLGFTAVAILLAILLHVLITGWE